MTRPKRHKFNQQVSHLKTTTPAATGPLASPVVQLFLGVLIICLVVVALKLELPRPFDLLPGLLFWVIIILILFGLIFLALWLYHWHSEQTGFTGGDENEHEELATTRPARPATTARSTGKLEREKVGEFQMYQLNAEGLDELSGWEILTNPELKAGRLTRLEGERD